MPAQGNLLRNFRRKTLVRPALLVDLRRDERGHDSRQRTTRLCHTHTLRTSRETRSLDVVGPNLGVV